jgi:hypothetical protein
VPLTLNEPSPTTRQVSARLPDGRAVLCVYGKRTYGVSPDGRLYPWPGQAPLVAAPEPDAANPLLLAADSDLYPFKPRTDVVVQGHAHPRGARACFDVEVAVGASRHTVRVWGDRRCALSHARRVLFSDPEPPVPMPLRYDRAYGGRDAVAEQRHGNPAEHLAPLFEPKVDPALASPYLYPRNPAGRGWVVEATAEGLDATLLPNFELPHDPLTPERLVASDPGRWWFHVEATNGASLGLQFAPLRGDEEFALTGLRADVAQWRFRLPGTRPRLWADGREGRLIETEPALTTVVVYPDAGCVTVVWRGIAPARRPYFEEELQRMPLAVLWPD